MHAGRPSIYSIELAEEICKTISCSNKGLYSLCSSNPHWPAYDTIYAWISSKKEFSYMYAEAKEAQADYLVDEVLRIIDKPETYVDEFGKEKNDVPMMRLKVDSLKWQAMKLKPRKYDKQSMDYEANKNNMKDLALSIKENKKEIKDAEKDY